MARAIAINLDDVAGEGSSVTPPPGPNVIPRNLPLEERSGGLPIVPGSTGNGSQPVTVGTSALPSSAGPNVIKPPPSATPTAAPWGKWLVPVALLIAALLLTSRETPRPK